MQPALQPGKQPSPWLASQTGSIAVEQNRVLRNTYILLALSMVPTVVGALVGMSLNLAGLFKAYPVMAPIGMFLAMMGMLFLVQANRESSLGVVLLLGFTFVAGLFLAPILQYAASLRNGGQLVAMAGGMTAVVFFTMATIATVSKRDFSFMGKFLMVGVILLIVASLANLFFQVPAVSLTISAVAVLLFSMWLLYDISNIVRGGETNYVSATLSVYMSLYNIFVSLLNLLMAFSGQRD
jgi:FtsH-binding integral membrane protein